jgi:hypothetical protein
VARRAGRNSAYNALPPHARLCYADPCYADPYPCVRGISAAGDVGGGFEDLTADIKRKIETAQTSRAKAKGKG